jgi:restriction system protein
MARRKKGELLELMKVASTWPWAVSAVLVPVSYLGFHIAVVSTENIPAPTPAPGVIPIIPILTHTFASILQYVFPAIFLVAALISFIRQRRSRAVFDGVRSNAVDVASLTWLQFERLVAEGFRHRGFQVSEKGGPAPDDGIDLEMSRGAERFLVQCKQWRARQVGVSVVRELYGVMASRRATGGFVVTSGSFSPDAQRFADGKEIELIDGAGLDRLLKEGAKAPPPSVVSAQGARGSNSPVAPVDSLPDFTDAMTKPPACPSCNTPMVLRTAKQGSRKGSSFWGCPRYPGCRGIVNIG